jgi:hypothetical protein
VHNSCPEAESRENPRERERKIQGQEKRESQRKLKMRRGIRDDASFMLQGVRARLRSTAVAVVNHHSTENDLPSL